MYRHEPEPEPTGPSMLLEKLPAHVLRDVFGFLSAGDVARAACACKTFKQVARSESLWRKLLSEKLGSQASIVLPKTCLLYTSPSPRDQRGSRMPSSA